MITLLTITLQRNENIMASHLKLESKLSYMDIGTVKFIFVVVVVVL